MERQPPAGTETMMEIAKRFQARHTTGFGAYMALERALIRRFIARGGTAEEFCARLAPVFHRRFAPGLLSECRVDGPMTAARRAA